MFCLIAPLNKHPLACTCNHTSFFLHRYVYFNYRERARQQDEESDSEQEPDDPLRDVSDRNFHENIKVGVIDLINMCRVEGLKYEGHVGFSGYPAWYICLAASENYLGRLVHLNFKYKSPEY